jgi:hypothetical protein
MNFTVAVAVQEQQVEERSVVLTDQGRLLHQSHDFSKEA